MNRLSVLSLAFVITITTSGCRATVQAAKVPVVTSVSPTSVVAGGQGFTLTVNGSNFNGNSNVLWNGSPRPTVTISSTQLLAFISSADIATPGTVQISVVDPKPTPEQSNSFALTIQGAPLTITTSSLPTAVVQLPYSAAVANSGGVAPYTWKVASGQLPPGLALEATSGAIAGVPGQAGKYSFTAQVTDSSPAPQTASQPLAVSVTAPSPLVISTTSLPNGTVQVAYSATLAAAGGTAPYSWSVVSGSFPPGLTLSASTGALSGAPTATGSYSFSVQVKDSEATPQTATGSFNISVAPPPLQITTMGLPGGTVNTSYSASLSASGGVAPYSWSVIGGQLPTGLTLSSTGTISGTPSLAGAYTFIVQVKDSSAQSTSSTLGIYIANAPLGGGGSLCGLQGNSQIYIPPSYTTFVPPAKGGLYVDPAFGCTVTRLTDGEADVGMPIYHYYATRTPVNSNSTKILLLQGNGNLFVTDMAGNILVTANNAGLGNAMEPMWSRTDPNIIYAHPDIRFFKIDVSGAIPVWTLLHTFTEYTGLDTGNENDLSDDSDHMGIAGTRPDGTTDIFVYTISTNTKGPVFNFPGSYDSFKLTHTNRVVVAWGVDGTARNQGIEFFDQNMNFLRQLSTVSRHGEPAVDPATGKEYVVYEVSNDPDFPCNPTGIGKVQVDTRAKTCLLAEPWNLGQHVSVNNTLGWVLISPTDGNVPGTDSDNAALPTNWQALWQPYYNELILIKLDGSVVQRLAQHRSRAAGPGTCAYYWAAPRPALSMDARYVVFDSNMARIGSPLPGCTTNYADVYLIKIQ